VGLNYLSLDRSAETLSGGESQRIRLASQIGSGLTGVMYVLDEPSIGLHQRDNDRLIGTLKHLRDIGNSVLVVEHDEDMMRAADHVIDMGLGAGIHGGRVIAQGTFDDVKANPDSLTGKYLAHTLQIAVPRAAPPWLPTVLAERAQKKSARQSAAQQSGPGLGRAPRRAPGHAGRPAGDSRDQRHRQQPARRECGVSGGAAHLRDRRVRLGQVHAGQRHLVRRRGAPALPRARRARPRTRD
jgi:excinuclease ABC subunit A